MPTCPHFYLAMPQPYIIASRLTLPPLFVIISVFGYVRVCLVRQRYVREKKERPVLLYKARYV